MLFAALPAHGHTYPLVPLAMAFQGLGADVLFATGSQFEGRLPVPTTLGAEPGWRFADAHAEAFARMPQGRPPTDDFARVLFVDVASPHLLEPTCAVVERWRPDLVVVEQTNVAGAVAARRVGAPTALFSVVGWGPRWDGVYAAALERWGADLRGTDGSPVASVAQVADVYLEAHPAFLREAGTGSHDASFGSQPPFPTLDLAPHAWSEPGPLVPEWLTRQGRPGDPPRVLLTLGTVFADNEKLLAVADEVAAAGCEVLAVTGRSGLADEVAHEHPAVHVEPFVDQVAVLGHVDLVVHHGGSGTVLGAVQHGLPQVVVPQGADQFWNGNRLVEQGAARVVLPGAPPSSVREAVTALVDPAAPERAAARRLQSELAQLPEPAAVAAELMRRFAPGSRSRV
ncbi:glycosyltransferase [Terrabacter aerolatus]|uniref:Glycosyl transferase n=1 Tax=Terrabacter aerolatus TaxID=422442 RepID=A0A512D308_9MICO|nr:glycosyl transferase [Terrabacter aerolatus]